MIPASTRFSRWYWTVVMGIFRDSAIWVDAWLPSFRSWRISPAVRLAMAFAIFWAFSSPGSRMMTPPPSGAEGFTAPGIEGCTPSGTERLLPQGGGPPSRQAGGVHTVEYGPLHGISHAAPP